MRTFRFEDLDLAIPILQVKIAGIDTLAIVDTGSEVSLIDYSFAIDNKISVGQQSETTIAGAVASNDSFSKPFDVAIGLKDDVGKWHYYSLDGIVVQMPQLIQTIKRKTGRPIALILGSDWFRSQNAIINLRDNTISIGE